MSPPNFPLFLVLSDPVFFAHPSSFSLIPSFINLLPTPRILYHSRTNDFLNYNFILSALRFHTLPFISTPVIKNQFIHTSNTFKNRYILSPDLSVTSSAAPFPFCSGESLFHARSVSDYLSIPLSILFLSIYLLINPRLLPLFSPRSRLFFLPGQFKPLLKLALVIPLS